MVDLVPSISEKTNFSSKTKKVDISIYSTEALTLLILPLRRQQDRKVINVSILPMKTKRVMWNWISVKIGRQYQRDISKNGNLVIETIISLIAGKKTTVNATETPGISRKLHKSSSFVEDYSHWKRHLFSYYVLSLQFDLFNPMANNKY